VNRYERECFERPEVGLLALRRLDVIGPGRDFGSEVPNAVYRVVWEKVLTKRLKVQPPEMGPLQGSVVQVEASM